MFLFGGVNSGLDTNAIVETLAQLSSQPIVRLEAEKLEVNDRIAAFQDLAIKLTALNVNAVALNSKLSIGSHKVKSSNEDILTAQVAGAPDVGTHTIKVNQLAQGEETLAQGFAAQDSVVSGYGTLTIKAGNATDDHDLNSFTKLSFLNNGTGVNLGSIQITDRSGSVATIDLSNADTIQDVLDEISGNTTVNVTAAINEDGDGITIFDDTGSTNGPLKILESGGTTAANLGILTSAQGVTENKFVGSDVDPLYSIQIDSNTNTLEEIRDAINDLNGPFSSSIINTGSGANPYRLSIVSENTGVIGALTFATNQLAITNELVGTGDGTSGAVLGDFSLSTSPISVIGDVSSITVGGTGYTVRAIGGNTGVGNEVEVDLANGNLQFFVNGVASNVTGEIRATYTPTAPSLTFTEIQKAEDAQIELGTTSPVAISKHTNTISGVISGVTLNLESADSSKTVLISAENDIQDLSDTISNFFTEYNNVVDVIRSHNAFDEDTGAIGGPLFGNSAVFSILGQLSNVVSETVQGLPSSANSIFAIGITPGAKGALNVNKATLEENLINNFEAVKRIFSFGRNIASTATVTATSTATGYNVQDLVNGVTSSANFGPDPGEGYQDNTASTFPDNVTLDFTNQKLFNKVVVHTIDTVAQPASALGVRDYEIQALKAGGDPADDDDYETILTITNNTEGKREHFINAFTSHLRVKVNGVNAADGFTRLVEIETHEATGVGQKLDNFLTDLTNSTTGFITTLEQGESDNISRIDTRIEIIQARVDNERERNIKLYARLEEALASLQTASNFLVQQLNNLPSFSQRNG